MWTNPLDRAPQIRQDWANHIVYGGVLGLVLLAALQSAALAFAGVLAVAAVKKVVDFFKEAETWYVCLGKAIVTALWPASIWVALLLA